MKKTAMSLLLVTLASVSSVALADSWKDGRHGREYKQEYWDGNCKVERKWEKDGDYKEKRKCKRRDRHYSDHRYDRPVVHRGYYPANSNYYPEYSRYDRRDPQVNIDIRIR